MTQTQGLCAQCLTVRPAIRSHNGQSVLLTTYCPDHGPQVGIREKSLEFYRWICGVTDVDAAKNRLAATFINVNDRCNMACPDCYHMPGLDPDYDVEQIMNVAKMVTLPYIAMLGAEPTMRDDLHKLIPLMVKETGRKVGIFTNGLKLASRPYADRLASSGLDYACLSLHLPDYTTSRHHELKHLALRNVVDSGIKLGHVAFCVHNLDEIGRAIDASFSVPMTDNTYFRIRAPGRIGDDPGSNFHLSDMVNAFFQCLKDRGLHGEVQKGSHPYMLIVQVKGRNYYLLRWPSIEELDLEEIKLCTARGLLVPELGETPLMHHVHVWAERRRHAKRT